MGNFSKWERIATAFYFVWFFVHLGLFFYSEESADNSFFWPFCPSGKTMANTYDVTEFLIYIGAPLILLVAYKIVYATNPLHNPAYHYRQHGQASFFIAFLNEKIKAEELLQKINELQNLPVSYDYLNQLKTDREKAESQSVAGWLNRIEVKKKYKEFESRPIQ